MPNPAAARSSLAIDNLRAVVILLVLAFHSVLAYLSFLPPHPFAFDSPPYLWRAFPIVDQQRWIGFDLFCAWLDVFLMSFFFLLSGLFTWPSLTRKGAGAFLRDRVLRLGVPFALGVTVLMPLAHYPVYLQTATDPSLADYGRQWLALPLWPAGPMWFLWLLLVGDAAAAGLYRLMIGHRQVLIAVSVYARRRPVPFLIGLALASALAYVPLALVFGPSDWFQRGPFSFQLSRPLHYAVYFLGGVAIGAAGIERGLAACDGPLARHWRRWVVAAPPSFALWAGLTGWTMNYAGPAPLGLQLLADLSFVLATLTSCGGALALALRFDAVRCAVLDRLRSNAYGMFLVHYMFVVWLQYALLAADIPAILKAAIVFTGAVLLSWHATAALRRIPAVARIIGGGRRPQVAVIAAGRAGSRCESAARHSPVSTRGVLLDERADAGDGAARLRHHRGEEVPDMRHARPDL